MIEQARALLAAARRPVAFSGAGLSAESGVATFRGAAADTGGDARADALWSRFGPVKLASPAGFAADPDLVLEWYAWRRRALRAASPNPAHRALAARSEVINVTQNVDDLLQRAGAAGVIQLHGSITADRCHRGCGYRQEIDLNDLPPPRPPGTPPAPHRCPRCGARLRPAVVWFGEPLPAPAWREAEQACASCEVLLVIGTSALVYPAAGLIHTARAAGARIIVVNTEPTAAGHAADLEIIGPAGTIVSQLL